MSVRIKDRRELIVERTADNKSLYVRMLDIEGDSLGTFALAFRSFEPDSNSQEYLSELSFLAMFLDDMDAVQSLVNIFTEDDKKLAHGSVDAIEIAANSPAPGERYTEVIIKATVRVNEKQKVVEFAPMPVNGLHSADILKAIMPACEEAASALFKELL